jgi:hypothetical protein
VFTVDRIIPVGFSNKGIFAYILNENSCRGAVDGDQDISWIAIDYGASSLDPFTLICYFEPIQKGIKRS